MTAATSAGIDYRGWFERWDRQQSAYIQFREERFSAMFDVLAHVVGDEFSVVDLACGCGSLTSRLLRRFPKAQVFAIDLDPLLLEIGRHAADDGSGRVRWLEGDLKEGDWAEQLPLQVDAMLSTTAIHWLPAGSIVNLYRTLASRIRVGGIFMNGDQMNYVGSQPTLHAMAVAIREGWRESVLATGAESWTDWWQEVRRDPALQALLEARDRRFAWRDLQAERTIGSPAVENPAVPVVHTTYAIHRAALLDAGFGEVDTVWQHGANRILAAVR